MSQLFYDRAGLPIEMMEWSALMSMDEYRVVAQDQFDDIGVSTVWLGLCGPWWGVPLIFETMIFGGAFAQHQWRYATEQQAIAGHQYACGLVAGELRMQTELANVGENEDDQRDGCEHEHNSPDAT